MSLLVTLQAVLLDGKTGEVLGKLGEGGKAHAGGIYSVSGLPCAVVGTACGGWHCVWWLALRVVVGTVCGGLKTVSAVWCDDTPCCPPCPTPSQLSWSPDSRQVLTASGDKSCKIFDVETSQVVTYVQWI